MSEPLSASEREKLQSLIGRAHIMAGYAPDEEDDAALGRNFIAARELFRRLLASPSPSGAPGLQDLGSGRMQEHPSRALIDDSLTKTAVYEREINGKRHLVATFNSRDDADRYAEWHGDGFEVDVAPSDADGVVAPTSGWIERVALAIEKADQDASREAEGCANGLHDDVSDWGAFLARAAIAAMSTPSSERLSSDRAGEGSPQGLPTWTKARRAVVDAFLELEESLEGEVLVSEVSDRLTDLRDAITSLKDSR